MEKSVTPINKGQQSFDTQEREELFNKYRGIGHEKEYKENRELWGKNPKGEIVADYPLHVDIEASSICNLKCPMCYTITDKFKSKVDVGLMNMKLYRKIVDECAEGNVFSIRLSLRGESFLHTHILDMIHYAKEKGIKEVSSLTNGAKMTPEFSEKLIESGIDWITVSVDGVDETYEDIRKPIKFETIIHNLSEMARLKKEKCVKKPVIKVQGVWPAVEKNPERFIDLLTPISDLIYINPLVDYLMKDDVENITYIKYFSCPQLYQRLVITSNGLVKMCANDQTNEQVVGDANSQTVHGLWHSEKMTWARDIHRRHMATGEINICKKCQLPREIKMKEVKVKDRVFYIQNYLDRSQVLGT